MCNGLHIKSIINKQTNKSMNKIIVAGSAIMMVVIFALGGCSKSDNAHVPVTRLLGKLSLDSTKCYMQGQWHLWAIKGGIGGPGVVNYYKNSIMNFDTATMKVQEFDNGTKFVDTTFTFVKVYNIYTGIDSLWTLHEAYYDLLTGYFTDIHYFPYQIINDTMVFRQWSFDGTDFYLKK